MLYAIATHPLSLYLDYLTSSRHLHGLKLPSSHHFVAQAYADDSMFWPKNRPEDVQCIIKALHIYGLAAGLQVNIRKSKLFSLCQMDCHSVLWPGEIVKPDQIVRHLGYPLAWSVHNAILLDWVENKLRSKLHYWKLSTWSLHVRLRIVQSILVAYVQFFLPMLHWPPRRLRTLMSRILEHSWSTTSWKKGLRLLPMDKLCTPKRCGGLNILHLGSHVMARKATLLLVLVEQRQPWTQMLAYLCSNAVSTLTFGHWQPSYWDVIFGEFEATIPGCSFTSSLVADWKLITRDLLWHGRDEACGNSLRLESLHWSQVFDRTLVQCSPRQAYFLFQKGIESINDVTDING
ncbi:hypothetical protein L7F22_000839 [Adiantum nelumboides]|nr:hypothetical protein [Adiantum nelumboides]